MDNCQSWELQSDGNYQLNCPQKDEEQHAAQTDLLEKLAMRNT
jgi:polyphosphate kinase